MIKQIFQFNLNKLFFVVVIMLIFQRINSGEFLDEIDILRTYFCLFNKKVTITQSRKIPVIIFIHTFFFFQIYNLLHFINFKFQM